MAKDARNLSSRVGFDTGFSSRSGCGEALAARFVSIEGDTTEKGRWVVSDLRKLLKADSARWPVDCATLDRSKDAEPRGWWCSDRSELGDTSWDSERPGCPGRG